MGDDSKHRDILIQELGEALQQLAEQTRLSGAEKVAALERLAAGVAHDVNNALTTIAGYTSMLMRDFEPDAPGYEDLEAIRRAAARIRLLTRQLQAFSRRQMLRLVEMNLNDLLSGLAPQLQEITGAEVQLEVNLALDLGTAQVDPEQMQWALTGLVQNAREATAPGGRVTLETANVEVLDECACQCGQVHCGSYVMLAVRDTGAGMDEETAARAFDPFFTTKGKRAGMGLPVAYGIVTLSHGHIAMESAPDRGTTVRIYLPRVSGAAQTAAAPVVAAGGAKIKVLLVEDEEDVRYLVKRLLTQAGYDVLEAEDGESALELLRRNERPDLLVTDLGLPGEIDGRQLAKQAAAYWPDLKVMFISGSSDELTIPAEIHSLLEKPFSPGALLAAVKKVMEE